MIDVAGEAEGRPLTTAEWIKGIFAQGMVYTRLFDEKLGVSQKAKALATKVSASRIAHYCRLVHARFDARRRTVH